MKKKKEELAGIVKKIKFHKNQIAEHRDYLRDILNDLDSIVGSTEEGVRDTRNVAGAVRYVYGSADNADSRPAPHASGTGNIFPVTKAERSGAIAGVAPKSSMNLSGNEEARNRGDTSNNAKSPAQFISHNLPVPVLAKPKRAPVPTNYTGGKARESTLVRRVDALEGKSSLSQRSRGGQLISNK